MSKYIIILSLLVLSACATKPKKPIELNYSSVDTMFSERDKDAETLRIVTPGETGKVAALTVLNFIVNGQARGFSKEELKGKKIEDAANKEYIISPARNVYKLMQEKLINLAEKNPELNEKNFSSPLYFSLGNSSWRLIYEKLSGNERKKYHIKFTMRMERTIGEESSISASCSYTSDKKLFLAQWKENSYKEVSLQKDIAAKSCVQQLTRELGRFLIFSGTVNK